MQVGHTATCEKDTPHMPTHALRPPVARESPNEVPAMKYAAAIAQLEIHARNCEHNAALQEHEGQHKDAAHNRAIAVEYRQAIDLLKAHESENHACIRGGATNCPCGNSFNTSHCTPVRCAWNQTPKNHLL